MDWKAVALVAAGGALGAVLRFGVSNVVPRADFPWSTLLVNLVGAFVIGALAFGGDVSPTVRTLVVVGFLGAFTTASALSLETLQLWSDDRIGLAMTNMVANGVGGPVLALAGWKAFG